jgi:hypothetical protein
MGDKRIESSILRVSTRGLSDAWVGRREIKSAWLGRAMSNAASSYMTARRSEQPSPTNELNRYAAEENSDEALCILLLVTYTAKGVKRRAT